MKDFEYFTKVTDCYDNEREVSFVGYIDPEHDTCCEVDMILEDCTSVDRWNICDFDIPPAVLKLAGVKDPAGEPYISEADLEAIIHAWANILHQEYDNKCKEASFG